jgi:hypothetical protein
LAGFSFGPYGIRVAGFFMRGRMGSMAKEIISIMLAGLCLLFLGFTMFNDNPSPSWGGINYMMFVSGVGIALCTGALYWLGRKDNREK